MSERCTSTIVFGGCDDCRSPGDKYRCWLDDGHKGAHEFATFSWTPVENVPFLRALSS